MKLIFSKKTENLGSDLYLTSITPEETSSLSLLYNWIGGSWKFLSSEASRKGFITLADQTVVSGTNFLTGVIIGRACTKEEFGLYMLGFSIVLFAMNLQTALISLPYMVYSPRLKGSAHVRYTGSTLIHQGGMSVITVIALALGGVVLSLGIGPQELTPVMWVLVVVITFILFREYARRVCFANLRFKTALILDSCVAVVQVGSLFLLAYLGLLSISVTYWVIGLTCCLAGMGWLIRMRKTFVLQLTRAISDLGRNWSFGKWVFAGGLLWALSMNLYPWILMVFHGTASTGVWAACIGIIGIANPLLFGMQNFLGPRIAHSYVEGGAIALRRFLFKAGAVFLLMITPFCVILLLFGGSLIVILYGDKYAGNGLVVSILSLSFLVGVVVFCFSQALFVLERPDLTFRASFVGLIVLLGFGLFLIRCFGATGAAFSLALCNLVGLGVRYVYFSKFISTASAKQIR